MACLSFPFVLPSHHSSRPNKTKATSHPIKKIIIALGWLDRHQARPLPPVLPIHLPPRTVLAPRPLCACRRYSEQKIQIAKRGREIKKNKKRGQTIPSNHNTPPDPCARSKTATSKPDSFTLENVDKIRPRTAHWWLVLDRSLNPLLEVVADPRIPNPKS